jgi:hypothetical protein
MASRLYATALFALYQLSVLFGIVMLPLAIVARRAGVALPVHRIVTKLGNSYEQAAAGTR